MKKSLLFLFGPLVFACGSLSAQTYLSADFESGMPAGWTASPASGAWVVPAIASSGFAPPAHTVVCGINDDAAQASANPASTITTPVINLSTVTTVYLKYDLFYAGLTYQSITEVADLRYSTDGGATYTSYGNLPTGTSWSTNVVNLTTQLAGQSNVKIQWRYNDNGGWLYGACLDNIAVFTPSAIDANLTVVLPAAGSPQSYAMTGSNVNISGTIQNAGLTPITSMAIKYYNGVTTQTYNVSSVNVAAFGNYTFTHSVPYNVPTAGAHPIKVWVELTGDNNQTNDTMSTVINGAAFIPNHAVTIEEATGTWCGWCVRGIVFMDSIYETYGSHVNVVAVHNADPMVVATYDNGIGTLIGGYPSTCVNRDLVSDPSYAFDDYANSINDFGFADITPVVTYDVVTRSCVVTANTHFAVDLNGDYRLICVYTEDEVHNASGGQWDQHNYYSFQSQNLALTGNGFDYQAAPQVIPSAQMYYDFVARNIQGGFNGQAASIPATVTANSNQTYAFPAYTIPAGYDVTKMRVIVMLLDHNAPSASNYHILNSNWAPIYGGAVGIDAPVSLNSVNVYPNPFNQGANVEVNLASDENVTIEMFDMTGKLVSSQNEGSLAAGRHNIAVDGQNLSQGIYFVKVTAGTSVLTQKVSVVH